MFPGYRIEQALGGGHYAVYRAVEEATQRTVCLKVLENLAADSSFHAFWTDTFTRSQLQCSVLPRVLHYALAPVPYSVSEWVNGVPLTTLLGADDATLHTALTYVCNAVETLASASLIASDCHPSNWLLTETGAHYIDCGDVARSDDATSVRRDLGALFYFLATKRDAFGRWADTFRALGTDTPIAAIEGYPLSAPLIMTLLTGRAVGRAGHAIWAPEPERVDVRLSPVARIHTDGFVHVSRFDIGTGPIGLPRFIQWLDAHVLTGQSLTVMCEDSAAADALTQQALAEVRKRGLTLLDRPLVDRPR